MRLSCSGLRSALHDSSQSLLVLQHIQKKSAVGSNTTVETSSVAVNTNQHPCQCMHWSGKGKPGEDEGVQKVR